MPNNSSRWEPGHNAVHRLIQLLDALAIAFNRFRQRSFFLPLHNPPHQFDTEGWQAGCNSIRDEFNTVRTAFVAGYVSAYRRAERLTDEVIAKFASAGARDEATITAVTEATTWLGLVGTSWEVGTPRPWNYGVYDFRNPDSWDNAKRGEERFDKEFALFARYTPIRRALLSALARIAQTVPDCVGCRGALAHHPWPEGEKDLITQEGLLALVREAAPALIERVPEAPPNPPIPPTIVITHDRLTCYPPVPLDELRPHRPEPNEADIAAAMRQVPVALSESRFAGPAHLPASSDEFTIDYPAWLAFAEERGHGKAAAVWAIYRLVEAGRLYVVWPRANQNTPQENSLEHRESQAARYRGGRAATVTNWDLFEHGRILQIRSTPALWEWSRQREVLTSEVDVTEKKKSRTGESIAPVQARRVSRKDLPVIGTALANLYRVLEDTKTQYDRWSRSPNTEDRPADLIESAITRFLELLMPNGVHNSRDCPEVVESELDSTIRVALLDLRETIGEPFASASRLANESSVNLMLRSKLEDVQKLIEQPQKQETGGKGARQPKPEPIPITPEDLPERAKLAYQQLRQAVCKLTEEDGRTEADVTDEEAYAHLKSEHMSLPSFETWARYVREARNTLGQQKRKRRSKYEGRSAVPREHFGDCGND